MANSPVPIAVAEGDGIGPEIMAATLQILKAAGAAITIHPIKIGEKVYLSGQLTGMEPGGWDIIRQAKAFLKAPITTPQGGGYKSLNVTIRTTLGLYANVRPCISYYPFVETKHPAMDVVIIRENEEDLYTGIEYRPTSQTTEALKIITYSGCERIIRYAFEYAQAYQRKKVTCFTKDNILKITDGLFHHVFEEIGKEYPAIEKEHWIVDIGAAKLADTPNIFDVIVMPNLYGDILSDVAAQIAGSVGLAGSANIGLSGAMFEAIHGSAPRRAGQNVANPSGLLLAAIQMLIHIDQPDVATLIQNAWLKTLEDGIHTYDIFKEKVSKQKVGTKEFAQAVIARLGQRPTQLTAVNYESTQPIKQVSNLSLLDQKTTNKECVGVDVFFEWKESVEELVQQIQSLKFKELHLKMISNRGTQVWPNNHPETNCVDAWRCRFLFSSSLNYLKSQQQIAQLLNALNEKKLAFTQLQLLFNYNGQAGFSKSNEE
jgi:isocitrate dehydrogenase